MHYCKIFRLLLLLLGVLGWSIPSDYVAEGHHVGEYSYVSGSCPLEDCGDDGESGWESTTEGMIRCGCIRLPRWGHDAEFCGGESRLDHHHSRVIEALPTWSIHPCFLRSRQLSRAGPDLQKSLDC